MTDCPTGKRRTGRPAKLGGDSHLMISHLAKLVEG
jgi:hypothetical protein